MSTTATRVLGCPWWCTLGDDHDDGVAGDSLCHRADADEFGVQLQSAANWSTGVPTEGPGITTHENDLLTPEEARRMAQSLLKAADLIDESREALRRRIGSTRVLEVEVGALYD